MSWSPVSPIGATQRSLPFTPRFITLLSLAFQRNYSREAPSLCKLYDAVSSCPTLLPNLTANTSLVDPGRHASSNTSASHSRPHTSKGKKSYIVPARGSAECTGSITTDQKNNPCTWSRPLKHYCGQPKHKTSCNSLSMLKNYQSPEKGSILYLGLREPASVKIASKLDASSSPLFST